MFADIYKGKTVWLSGHTGFKGAWLARWLLHLGARVHGFALPEATNPSLFEQLGLRALLEHEIGDVRDAVAVKNSLLRVQPDFVFHLAAQALVRKSYEEPLHTYATNVMGTAHVLDAARCLRKPCGVIIVTSDKCYENREFDHAYGEEDLLGGHDPYSSSKAAAEIVTSSYRRSFFSSSPVKIATARAGNVIGGGDWSADRILPDCIRALQRDEAISVRHLSATRPWQHVLEPLSGYLCLGARLQQSSGSAIPWASAFNFGPDRESNRPVRELVEEILKSWPGRWTTADNPDAVHEARLLMLSTDKARHLLGWRPAWPFETAVARAVEWYRGIHESAGVADALTLRQIGDYTTAAQAAKIAWTTA